MKRNESEPKVPVDLRKVLATAPRAGAVWKGLTPIARRDFITWIESAKQEETRKRRVESIPSRLASGKRRPCCYAVVPMNLYKALDSLPRAKAQWNILTPDERRDFSDWISSAEGSGARAPRIDKTCALLLAGRRHI